MTRWQQWAQHPKRFWFRKAFFQIHLWAGLAVGLYVGAISVSGSLIVFRRDLERQASHVTVAAGAGRVRMGIEEIARSARDAHPACEVLNVVEPEKPDRPDSVVLECRQKRVERLFDPYTGADLGDPRSGMDRALRWLTDLHDNLLLGLNGRTLNGIGAFLLALLSLTGTVVWWPGIRNWRRSVSIDWKARFARFNWDVHSAVGFWCSLFVLIWGISGICLCFPGILNSVLRPPVRFWINQLHFGRFNAITEGLWTILGLAPALLACTGALMWWNRVLSKNIRSWRNKKSNTLAKMAVTKPAAN